MTDPARTFAVASDEALVELISHARSRLVVIAPALTQAVADAVSSRSDDLEQLSVTVILDSDPDVYRLGFGDQSALNVIRSASAHNLLNLREQPGVRIGAVIADDTAMVYSPASRNIEADSTSVDKPNAIVLTGAAAERIAAAAGAETGEEAPKTEVGNRALELAKVQEMWSNLEANPPKPFDITRKLNVFTSKVQYVEFSASNYRLTTRQIPLPPELVDVADDDLKNRITGRIRVPFDGIGKLEVTLDDDGKVERLKVDDDWLKKERKRIEDKYTFQINNFGRVILSSDRNAFDKEAKRFRSIVGKYQAVLQDTLGKSKAEFKDRIVDEFSPRWKENTPEYFARWGIKATPEKIKEELQRLAQQLFESAISFDTPVVKILYKGVSPENLRDRAFLEVLETIMHKRRVPREIIDSLFESGQAVPETGTFLGQ